MSNKCEVCGINDSTIDIYHNTTIDKKLCICDICARYAEINGYVKSAVVLDTDNKTVYQTINKFVAKKRKNKYVGCKGCVLSMDWCHLVLFSTGETAAKICVRDSVYFTNE